MGFEELKEYILNPVWWITSGVFGILIGLSTNQIQSWLDRKWKARNKKRADRLIREQDKKAERIAAMRDSDRKLLVAFREERQSWTGAIFFVVVAIFLVVVQPDNEVARLMVNMAILLFVLAAFSLVIRAINQSEEIDIAVRE